MKVAIKHTKKGLQDVLTFGRYKGRTVEELLSEDPNYLTWVHKNVDFFPLEPEVLDMAIEAALEMPRPSHPGYGDEAYDRDWDWSVGYEEPF